MDLLAVAEMSAKRTWKVAARDMKLGSMPPNTSSLTLLFSGLAV